MHVFSIIQFSGFTEYRIIGQKNNERKKTSHSIIILYLPGGMHMLAFIFMYV